MKARKTILIFLFLLALVLTSYPFLLRFLFHHQAETAITDFKQQRQSVPVQQENHGISETNSGQSEPIDKQYEPADKAASDVDYPELYAAMQAYNRLIFQQKQSGLDSVKGYETPALDVSQYMDSDAAGVISIPAMDVELPLYLGASNSNMAKGAVVLGSTSCPIGGSNTNCVIAGHRGYRGIPYFREIERLTVGDVIYITNPWETLAYSVTGWEIVTPDSMDQVKIQPGKDMVTLVTCHPYRVGSQRYLVYCQRVQSMPSEGDSEAVAPVSEASHISALSKRLTISGSSEPVLNAPSQPEIALEDRLEPAALLLVLSAGGWLVFTTHRKKNTA